MAASVSDEVEDLSTCSVCFSYYDEIERKPKFLPCSHTFCLPCLKSIHSTSDSQIVCPLCRKSQRLEVEGLPNNFYIIKMMELNKKLKEVKLLKSSAQWCLTCKCLIYDAQHIHDTIDLAQDGLEIQSEYDECCKNLNQSVQARIALAKHYDSRVESSKVTAMIKKAKLKAEKNKHRLAMLKTLLQECDNISKINKSVSSTRKKIKSIDRISSYGLDDVKKILKQADYSIGKI